MVERRKPVHESAKKIHPRGAVAAEVAAALAARHALRDQ
jgi:hypothetical protein